MNTRRYRSEYKRGKADGYAEGYAQGLHDGNPFALIAEVINKTMITVSDRLSDPEFLERLEKAWAIDNHGGAYIDWKKVNEDGGET